MPRPKVEEWQEPQILKMEKEGRQIQEISKTLGLSHHLIRKTLDKHGLRKQKKKQVKIDHEQIAQSAAKGNHKRLTMLFKPTSI